MTFSISDTNNVCNKVSKAGQLITIDNIRQKIVDGQAYYAWDNSFNGSGLVKDASWNAVFVCVAGYCHKIKTFIEADASVNLRIFEFDGPPIKTLASKVTGTPRNYNRNYTDNCHADFYMAPTGVRSQAFAGTEIRNKCVWGMNVAGTGTRASIGTGAEEYSFITNPDKYYLIHIYNRGPNLCSLHVHWRITEYTGTLTG